MNLVRCRCAVAVCCAAVLMLVNGQSTTDHEVGTDEIAQLREELAKSVARIARLEGRLAALVKQNAISEGNLAIIAIETLKIDSRTIAYFRMERVGGVIMAELGLRGSVYKRHWSDGLEMRPRRQCHQSEKRPR